MGLFDRVRLGIEKIVPAHESRLAGADAESRLARLRAEPGVDALVGVLPLLTAARPEVVERARGEVAAFVRALGPTELAHLDEAVRRAVYAASYAPLLAWPLSPKAVDAWDLADMKAAVVLGVASLHPSGYVREAALRRLASLQTGEALPFLLLRANDWVDPIRWVAEAALRSRMTAERAPEWVPHAVLVHRLTRSQRRSSDFVKAVTTWLASDAGQPVLWAGLDAPDGRVRRWSFRLLRPIARGNPATLAERAADSVDPVIRLEAVHLTDGVEPGEERSRLLVHLLADPVGRVRREALRALAPPPIGGIVDRALFDSDAGVREVARQLREAGGPVDFTDLYREAVDALDGQLRGALLGLGETGDRDDLPRFLRHLVHPQPSVRRAALRGLVRVDRPGATPALLDALGDNSPGVSRAARDTLGRADFAIAGRVESYFKDDARPHVRANALWLLVRGSKWSAIRWALAAAASPDTETAEQGRDHVTWWMARYNQIATVPTADDLDRVRVALDHATGHVPAAWEAWIRSAMSDFGDAAAPSRNRRGGVE